MRIPATETSDSAIEALATDLRQRLDRGERVLWTGRPAQGVLLRKGDRIGIPFSLLWCGFVIFWESNVLAADAPWFFALWGIPFVLVGLYMVAGRFIVDSWRRARTLYAVTDQRAVILSGFRARSLKSLDLGGLSDIELQDEGDGRGTLVLGLVLANAAANMVGRGWPGTNAYLAPAFERIDDAAGVLRLIREARARTNKDA